MTDRPPVDLLARALARRDLSETEARAKLAAAGADAPSIERAVAQARSAGWIDDARLAAHLVEREVTREPPPAPAALAERLRARGLCDDDVDRAVRAGASAAALAERAASWLVAQVRAAAGARDRAEARGRSATGARALARKLAAKLVRSGHAPEDVESWLERAGVAPRDDDGGSSEE